MSPILSVNSIKVYVPERKWLYEVFGRPSFLDVERQQDDTGRAFVDGNLDTPET